MFEPINFLNIAQDLYNKSDTLDPGMARTCINRAYYAAHHIVRESLKIKDDGAGSHRAVIKKYKNKNTKMGNKLSSLFALRLDADYYLDKKITKLNSGNAVRYAEEIFKDFKKL